MEVNIMVIKRNKKLLGFMLALATLSPLSAKEGFFGEVKTGYKKIQTTNAPSRPALTTSKNTSTAQTPSTTQNMTGGLLGWAISNPGLAMSIVSAGSVLVTLVFTRAYYKWTGRKTERQRDQFERNLNAIEKDLNATRADLQSKEARLQKMLQSHGNFLEEQQQQHNAKIQLLTQEIVSLKQELRDTKKSTSKWSLWN